MSTTIAAISTIAAAAKRSTPGKSIIIENNARPGRKVQGPKFKAAFRFQ